MQADDETHETHAEEQPPDPPWLGSLEELRSRHEILVPDYAGGIRCTTLSPPDFSQLKAATDGSKNLLQRIVAAIASIESTLKKDQMNQDQGYAFTSVDVVTQVGRDATSAQGVVFWVFPIRRSIEDITFRGGNTGRRLTIVFQATLLNADDPADRATWELEVANDGTGDKGHQVCHSVARKYGLIEALQLPRGNGDDAEAQPHPGLDARKRGRRSGRNGPQAVSEEAIADLLKNGKRDEAETMLTGAHAAVAQAGEITEPKSGRLYAIARENGWTAGGVEDTCKRLLKVEVKAGQVQRTFLGVSWKAYDLVIAFFRFPPPKPADPKDQAWGASGAEKLPASVNYSQTVPGPEAPTPGKQEAPSDEPDDWPWPRVWGAIRDAKSQLPTTFEPIGASVKHALDALVAATEWTADDIRFVLDTEIGMKPEGLPPQSMKTPPFFRMVVKAFHKFDGPPAEEPYLSAQPGEAVFDVASYRGEGWLELDSGAKWSALGTLCQLVAEGRTGEFETPIGPAEYLTLVNRSHNGGRTSAQIQGLLSRNLGITDPRLLPGALNGIVLAMLAQHPESDPIPEAPPHGWRQWTNDKLEQLAQKVGAPMPEGTGKGAVIVKSDWVAAIDARLHPAGASS